MLSYLLTVKIFLPDVNFGDIRSYIIGILLFFIINSMNLAKNKKISLLLVFCIINITTSFIIILQSYNGNYAVAIENIGVYFFVRKNQFSPLLLMSAIYLLYRYIYISKNSIYLILFLMCTINLVIIQSRTNLIALFLAALLLIFVLIKSKLKTSYGISQLFFFVALLIVLFAYNSEKVNQIVGDAFRLDYIQYSGKDSFIDNLTSGRISSLQSSLNIFIENPIFGGFYQSQVISEDPSSPVGLHNIWLRLLIYGGLTYFILFLILLITLYKYYYRSIKSNVLLLSVTIAGFVMSFAEPYAPFGPGTSYFMYWLILGFYIEFNSNNGLAKNNEVTLKAVGRIDPQIKITKRIFYEQN
ncbi:O-antigen ligase family protein [Paenibacillus abyssi]